MKGNKDLRCVTNTNVPRAADGVCRKIEEMFSGNTSSKRIKKTI